MIYDNDEWKNFISLLKDVSHSLLWSEEQYNNVIDFLSSLNEDTANYIIDLLYDFYNAGFDSWAELWYN